MLASRHPSCDAMNMQVILSESLGSSTHAYTRTISRVADLSLSTRQGATLLDRLRNQPLRTGLVTVESVMDNRMTDHGNYQGLTGSSPREVDCPGYVTCQSRACDTTLYAYWEVSVSFYCDKVQMPAGCSGLEVPV
jgi:hypothetical protein